jgi:hypothetical protein
VAGDLCAGRVSVELVADRAAGITGRLFRNRAGGARPLRTFAAAVNYPFLTQ